jgi:hypothetical protein
MYQLIVTHGAHTYSLFGNSLDISDYPTIPAGAFVCIPATGDLFYINGPKTGFDLDGLDNRKDLSILGNSFIGQMILGKE